MTANTAVEIGRKVDLDFLYRIRVRGSDRGRYFYGEREFEKTLANDAVVRMKFHSDGRSLRCLSADWQMPQHVFDEISTEPSAAILSPLVERFVSDTTTQILEAAEHLVSLIKYDLNHRDIHPSLVSSVWERWMEGGRQRDFPKLGKVMLEMVSVHALNDVAHAHLQRCLDLGIYPIRALVHLNRARDETIASHRWIEATIAAELAIKEVLCIARPELKSLLLECPAPPLSKLYGALLKEYLGEVSPYKSELARGAETRNKLIHRFAAVQVAPVEASAYVGVVGSAISHLLKLLAKQQAL